MWLGSITVADDSPILLYVSFGKPFYLCFKFSLLLFPVSNSRPWQFNQYCFEVQFVQIFSTVLNFLFLIQELDLKSLLLEVHHIGLKELELAVSFVARVLKGCCESKVIRFVSFITLSFFYLHYYFISIYHFLVS